MGYEIEIPEGDAPVSLVDQQERIPWHKHEEESSEYIAERIAAERKHMLKLYKIWQDEPDWDEYFGFIIAAPTQSRALEIAKDKGTYTKMGPEWTWDHCEVIGHTDLPEGLVFDSFHAG